MRKAMAALCVVGALCGGGAMLGSCDDEADPARSDAGGVVDAANVSDAPAVAPDSAATPALTGCLDSPQELARPPSGRLPCELIPPGLSL